MNFVFIYIREAHPSDGWQVPQNKGVADLKTPTTQEERNGYAKTCTKSLSLTLPTAVDGMDDAVSKVYAAWPERLYLVGTDGNIIFRGSPGPKGYNPDALEGALKKLAVSTASQPSQSKPSKKSDS